jgi:hypothetical protein
MQVPVKKMDFILVVFMAFLILIDAGFILPATKFNNLLAYTCVHSTGVILIASEAQSRTSRGLKLAFLILTSAIIMSEFTSLQLNASEQIVLLILFLFNNWFLIAGTILFLRLNGSQSQGLSVFRYLTLTLNLLFLYLYMTFPSCLFITKWWILSGVFYIPFSEPRGVDFWIATIFIGISIVSLERCLRKDPVS